MFADVGANGGDRGRHAAEGPPAQAFARDIDVISTKKRSTRFSQDAPVGVKWK